MAAARGHRVQSCRDASLGAGVLRLRDVTEQSEAVDEVGEESRFVSLAEALPVGVLSGDAEDFLVFANDAALSAFGRSSGPCEDEGGWSVSNPTTASGWKRASPRRSNLRTAQATFAISGPAEPTWLQILVVPLTQGGRYLGWVATLEDITARLAAERELAHRATHDALTGLPIVGWSSIASSRRWPSARRVNTASPWCSSTSMV